MTDSVDTSSKRESKITKETAVSLSAFEDNVRHDRAILLERESTARMSAAGLLEVARGGEHPSFNELSLKPTELLPPLPPNDSPGYAKILDMHVSWAAHLHQGFVRTTSGAWRSLQNVTTSFGEEVS